MAKYNAIGALVTDLTTIRSNLAAVNSGAKDDGTLRIVLATDQPTMSNAQPVSGTVTATGPLTDTQLRATPVPVSGTITATTGGLTDTQIRATPLPISGTVTANTGLSQPLTDTQLRATPVPVSGTVTATVTSTTITGTVATTQSTSPWVTNDPGLPNALGQSNMAGSTSVVIASDQSTVTVKEAVGAAATLSNVANSASNVTVLAANASRRMAMFFNDDTAVTGATLYLKFGATASATSYTIAISPRGYYELPQPPYVGIIDGIATAATGSCRVTEIT